MRYRLIISVIGSLLLGAAAALISAQIPAGLFASRPDLTMPKGDASIANIWLHDTITHNFTLTNDGPLPLDINRFDTSCGCTSLHPHSLRLNPGQSQSIAMVINLADRFPVEECYNARDFAITIIPQFKSPPGKSRHPLRFSGKVANCLAVSPSELQLRPIDLSLLVNSESFSITPCSPVATIKIESDDDYFSVHPNHVAVSHKYHGQPLRIAIATAATIPQGLHHWNVMVQGFTEPAVPSIKYRRRPKWSEI